MNSLITLTSGGTVALNEGLLGWTSAPCGGSDLAGHVRSIGHGLRAAFAPVCEQNTRSLSFRVPDQRFGSVNVTGLLRERSSDSLALIVHGLAGSATSRYCAMAAEAAYRAGYDSFRISMRGADMSGEDIYHAGLSSDIAALLSDSRFSHYRRIVLLGYSFGGNIALRSALDNVDSRLAAVAAICPPLDLAAVMNACDTPSRFVYKRAINVGLNRAYAQVEARGRAVTPFRLVAQARQCSDWNEAAIVPRFGFRSVQDYYEQVSVIPDLHRLKVPCLVVAASNDPIVPAHTVRWALGEGAGPVTVRWAFGGHLAFAPNLDLGMPRARTGLENQVFEWLRHV
ncbi:MAG TPA: alpha/beta fold hydrolase [Bryobacteraceae bacterium]|nr:alpha/beta fold hydrolase [Bryobacteraceae bacterium]